MLRRAVRTHALGGSSGYVSISKFISPGNDMRYLSRSINTLHKDNAGDNNGDGDDHTYEVELRSLDC